MIHLRLTLTLFLLGLAAAAPARAQTAATVTYFHTDAIGSVRMITNEIGQAIAHYDYLPFGEPCGTACGPVTPPHARQFAGKERDTETDFEYFGARYYASGSGRFTTVDPVLNIEAALTDPQRWNRYAYARNNPFRYVDPDGLDPLPAVWLQFFNAMFRTDFSAVDVKIGVTGRFVTDTADANGVTLGHSIFLSPQAADDFAKLRPEGIVLIGHELTHVQQYRVLDALNVSFLAMYLGEYAGNLIGGQSAYDAYRNITAERQAFGIEQRIRTFLADHNEILRKLQSGIELTRDELMLIESELGVAILQ